MSAAGNGCGRREDGLSDAEVITDTTHPRPYGRAGSGGATRLRLAGAATGVDALEARVSVPGGVLACTIAGSGEPLLLVHGLGGTRRTWLQVIGSLATTHTVIAPDLPGHGESDAPAGDYSLGAHATALRDLLVALGYSSATVAGHSLGGGIGLQFAYQFPERTRRLVLISTGGLGPELSPILRAVTLPGAHTVVAGLAWVPEGLTRQVLPLISMVSGLVARQDAASLTEVLRGLAGSRQRRTFLRTAHAVIDWRGQTVSAARHLDLLTDIPVLVAWGTADKTIPPHHHQAIAGQIPDPRTVEIAGAGHYPHETAPEQLLPPLHDFLQTTAPFHYNEARWRELLNPVVNRST